MIGIMNVGSDTSVEFYASARQSSLYARKPSKDSRTYTADGRVLINGVPETRDTPEDLWRSLIVKAVTSRAVKDVEARESSGFINRTSFSGPLAVIRRFSSKLRFQKSQKDSVLNEEHEPSKLGPAGRTGATETNGDDQKHVTVIRVKTVQKKNDNHSEDMMNDEVRIYAQEGILKRLMEEKAMIEKEMGGVTMEWATDSGRASLDEEHEEIVVERF
ncbi:hypothetical protein Q1695_013623 [Nippostrongylus brasiliensis]|nr:hypothetical protein Q1695_013623 [Nippostrongylus brasiliensis]